MLIFAKLSGIEARYAPSFTHSISYMKPKNTPTPAPHNAQKRKSRVSPLLVFVLVASAVMIIGYAYQQQHATPIPEPTGATSDSLNLQRQTEGAAFLEAKSKEAGVQTLGGGILYKELKAGEGVSPTGSSTVKVHYEGKLIDGTIFDSSYNRGEPAEFPVGGVVSGWQIALKAMKPGAIWELYLPHYMAYGERGSGANIPPYSTLIFKIELLEVK